MGRSPGSRAASPLSHLGKRADLSASLCRARRPEYHRTALPGLRAARCTANRIDQLACADGTADERLQDPASSHGATPAHACRAVRVPTRAEDPPPRRVPSAGGTFVSRTTAALVSRPPGGQRKSRAIRNCVNPVLNRRQMQRRAAFWLLGVARGARMAVGRVPDGVLGRDWAGWSVSTSRGTGRTGTSMNGSRGSLCHCC